MDSTNVIRKKFYREHPRVELREWEVIERFLNLHQIKFSGFDMPKPIFYLDEINFPEYILDELKMQGVQRPTAIQSLAWPSLYNGRDLMCIGLPTNSRVISFICPALVHIKQQDTDIRRKGPLVLIATQTKEVAKEILTHSQMFMHQAQCSFCCLFDDENINTQALQLKGHDPDVIIGNYHRLCELMDNQMVNLKNVSFLIMDDFYRNRSARLSDEIKRVINETRTDRQTAIYSRIVPSGLQKSNGDEYQNDAIFICIGNDDINVHHKDMPQQIHICTMAEKKKKLQDIITEIQEKEKNPKILVYANGFKKIRITEKIIKELGVDVFAYERTSVGRRRKMMKEKVYYNFNVTQKSILVASDVVSNRVELPDLNYVINADFPVNLSLYLNRMRNGIKRYISIFIAEDARHADRLIYALNECRQEVPPILYKISEAYINSGKDVDRMPSLSEISEGLTKPVEKPIPKPLPPTVPLQSNNVTTAKRPLEEKLKQQRQRTTSEQSNSPPPTPTSIKKSKTKSYLSETYSPFSQPPPPPITPQFQMPPPSYYYPSNSFVSSFIQGPYISGAPVTYPQQNVTLIEQPEQQHQVVKLEPMEIHQHTLSQIEFSDQNYFSNAIPFKREAIYEQHPLTNGNQATREDDPSTRIVNNLLKDNKVLSLLDKVVQSFNKQPNQHQQQQQSSSTSSSQSTYQGSWNFNS